MSEAEITKAIGALEQELRAHQGRPSSSAFEIGSAIANLLYSEEQHAPFTARILKDIENLYLLGDVYQQRFIVDVILEHAFESDRGRELFLQWKDQPVLADAFDEAEQWARTLRENRKHLLEIAEKSGEMLREMGAELISVAPVGLGTESVELRWRSVSNEGTRRLVFVAGAGPRTKGDDPSIYALDQRNWRRSHDLDDEWIVEIPLD